MDGANIWELDAESGWFDRAVAAEFPTLAMRYATIDACNRPSSPSFRASLRDHSRRFTGADALNLPRRPIPAAYRAFFRQIGLDPDVQPSPVEAIAHERILRGMYPTRGTVADAVLIATVESHVALTALDADTLDGPLGIRPARDTDDPEFPRGTLVVADAEGPVAHLFDAPGSRWAVTSATRRVTIVAVGVPGMNVWVLDDALWRAADLIQSG